jgi:outer membrane receptor protein involved in Fe transport
MRQHHSRPRCGQPIGRRAQTLGRRSRRERPTRRQADSLTWTRGNHTVKGGVDIQRFNWTSPVNFTGADDFGVFRFNNNIVAGGTGNPVANFLLGTPTDVDQTASGPGVDGVATHYSLFAQDDWRINPRVTLSYGLRYDLRPGFIDREGNISNFLRGTVNGDVVVPDAASLALTSPGFAGSIGSTRILTAGEAGLPISLRNTDKNNIAPRLGLAWRPGASTRTVLRGGYGV